MRKIRRGLDLPISGAPRQSIEDGPTIRSVAVVGFDYHGMKPSMSVQVGDKVKLGQELLSDKKRPGVKFTAPAAGTVAAINRGAQRVLQSVVIDVEGDEAEEFASYAATELDGLSREQVRDNLVNSGLWTALRTRPYSHVPTVDSSPKAIFVSILDTNPLAADPSIIIDTNRDAFVNGLKLLSKLTDGKVYVGHGTGSALPDAPAANVVFEGFEGVHPAGNVGTQIHFLEPAALDRVVWTLGYQDVMAFGELFTTGRLPTGRIVSLAGPQVENPRLLRTRLGASLDELTAGELKAGENRIVSGSVFGGRTARGPLGYLGRHHNQVSVLLEGRQRFFLHYLRLGLNRFSAIGIYMSSLFGGKLFDFTTTTNGGERAMVPIGNYERVMPLDILATQLLRSLIVEDTEMAQKLGCLELDEEDLALCTFVCPGKYEYGPILRKNLARIEKEG